MPSGAKKRKAAKKRKQNQSNSPSHLNAAGEGDVDRESDDGENRSPKSQGEEEEIAQESRVKGDDQKHLEVGESVKIEDDGSSSPSGSNSDDENQGGIKNRKAESSIDSSKVGDSVSIEATRNSKIDESIVGEAALLMERVELRNEQSPSDISVSPPYVVQSAVKENGEKKFTTSVEHRISSFSSLETTIDQSDANPRSINGEQNVKESLVIQPLFLREKTSWKSCCGLFEVFNRSAA